MNVKEFTAALCERASSNVGEVYSSALEQMEGVYVAVRTRLVGPPLHRHLQALLLASTHPDGAHDLATGARHATTYVLSVCQLELSTYESFFVLRSKREALKGFLETLGGIYYDLLRPAVVHCDKVDELREVAIALSMYVLEPHSHSRRSAVLAPLLSIVFRLNKDVQERLIYRAETLIMTEIRGFEPQLSDLDYPRRLDDAIRPHSPQDTPLPRPSLGWYPTLTTLLICLSKIYGVLERSTFQSMAQEAVSVCLGTLLEASKMIQQEKGQLDALLFLIKHLLILREQIGGFDCDLIQKEKFFNFGSVANRIRRLVVNRERLQGISFDSPAALFKLFTPTISESRNDARHDLELGLRHVCGSFVAHCSALILLPLLRLSSIFGEAHASVKQEAETQNEQEHVLLRKHPSFSDERLAEAVRELNVNLSVNLPAIIRLLRLYVSGPPQPLPTSPLLARFTVKTTGVDGEARKGDTPHLSIDTPATAPDASGGSSSSSGEPSAVSSPASPTSPPGDGRPLGRSRIVTSGSASSSHLGTGTIAGTGIADLNDSVGIILRPLHVGISEAVRQCDHLLRIELKLSQSEMDNLHWNSPQTVEEMIGHLLSDTPPDGLVSAATSVVA
eukprot:GHVN01096480.1.p1 GENE.GHVN01096480.1~~GHVN01096480.1.p1  ORF type:complete len:725 (+),score=132.78 GHVN01096480.1:320-2176(+)